MGEYPASESWKYDRYGKINISIFFELFNQNFYGSCRYFRDLHCFQVTFLSYLQLSTIFAIFHTRIQIFWNISSTTAKFMLMDFMPKSILQCGSHTKNVEHCGILLFLSFLRKATCFIYIEMFELLRGMPPLRSSYK